jgi:dihydrofolate synthase / folylpolyglutamate synthase
MRNRQSAINPMDYPECIAYLEKLGNEVLAMEFGLDNIRRVLDALGNPQQKYSSVLIAGTNGKGSVARFLSSVLTRGGYRTASYTSPHLVKLEERFVINNETIDPETFAQFFTRVVEAVGKAGIEFRPTYFETLTALAFLYFAAKEVDIAVLEVGMGGRLDSTNVVEPELSIITPIGLDHQKFLGATVEAIAGEKAGIIHPGRPVLISGQRPEARAVISREAAARGAPLMELENSAIKDVCSRDGRYSFRFRGIRCNLQVYGKHQVENAALAVQAAQFLNGAGFPLPADRIAAGISQATLEGRVQLIGSNPLVIVDGAHNRDAVQNLASFVREHTPPPRNLVFAMMRDKEIGLVLEILKPHFQKIYLTEIRSARSASLEELLQRLPEGIPVAESGEAFRQARLDARTVVVAGSFYLAGQILRPSADMPR